MTANNSCGGRSIRYGTMRANVASIDAVLADGTRIGFGETDRQLAEMPPGPAKTLAKRLCAIADKEADEVAARFPKVHRRVGGYNLDALDPARERVNLAHLLVGSEGTLAYSTAITLKLSPLMGRRALGICHFGSFHRAMEAAQHLVKLKPIAVELIDDTMIALAREIPIFHATLAEMVRGAPAALLLVEFDAGEEENRRRMRDLEETMGDLGLDFRHSGKDWGGVVAVHDPALQESVTELRKAGLNIMMSMKERARPISFVEDCAVPLPHLADYTARLTEIFARHGTRGTWYAHASEGCLHVRPVLNLRLDKDVRAMRAIAEEAFAMVREYKGSHSGEHGDGLVRSEFHEPMFGSRLVGAFREVKRAFDPDGVMNPGKIVDPPKFDDRRLFRLRADDRPLDFAPRLDWSAYPGASSGFQGAVEQCNNNGACRKLQGGAMCPSYRVTRDEAHVTRGRANALRLAMLGRLGPDPFAAPEMMEAMRLCVSCKACKRECPTGVDMARLKIEVLAARRARLGLSRRDRLIAGLPHHARWGARLAPFLNLAARSRPVKRLIERALGFSARRTLPRWRRDRFEARGEVAGPADGAEVALWADTFNAAFEPDNLRAAIEVLAGAGYRVTPVAPPAGERRPLCCGRTFLAVGDTDAARAELERSLAALRPFIERGVPIVGLEPSCLYTFRDEAVALLPGNRELESVRILAIEDFIAEEAVAGRFSPALAPIGRRALLHGHCHQKAFDAMGAVGRVLALIPGLEVESIESSCCGMAGAFGYQAATIDVSLAMGELSLLPAVRAADAADWIVADGTSCRHQIADGAARPAHHVVHLLAASMAAARGGKV
jgi:FAD/FMN-containing dehydrogenase/Fe-S oxidoreductase